MLAKLDTVHQHLFEVSPASRQECLRGSFTKADWMKTEESNEGGAVEGWASSDGHCASTPFEALSAPHQESLRGSFTKANWMKTGKLT